MHLIALLLFADKRNIIPIADNIEKIMGKNNNCFVVIIFIHIYPLYNSKNMTYCIMLSITNVLTIKQRISSFQKRII